MAARIVEIQGSGDYTRGWTSSEGVGRAVVFDAAHQGEAEALALTFFPPIAGGLLRSSIAIADLGGDHFSVEVQYRNAVPAANETPEAGEPPPSTRPEPPAGGKSNTDPLTRDMTFSTGGATRKRMYSILTRHHLSKNPADPAPNFGKLIGVTKDGKVEGCEVLAPAADFTITKRFPSLTIGWFRTMLDLVANTNDADWLGMARGEVLFKGADGNFKDGDPNPWTVTGKFGYSRNLTRGDSDGVDDALTVGDIEIPDVRGWEYVWVNYQTKVVDVAIAGGPLKVPIDYPRWVYVEQVYLEGALTELGLDV